MGRYLRWQAAIALLGILVLGAVLSYAAYNFTSVTVPDRGGTFVEGMAGTVQHLNPLLSHFNRVDSDLVPLLFDGLTKLDEQGNVAPELAEKWTTSPDGLTYDFRLKPDLFWHDGMPLRAADVLFTVGVMQHPDFPGVMWLGDLWRAVKVTAPDGPEGLAVRFQLEQPFAPFLDYTTIGLLPAHLWERVPVAQMMDSQYNTRPVGSGPFQLTDISATRVELAPNPRYRGPTPYIAGFTVRLYPDYQSLLPAYDRGEIDAISWISPGDLPAAGKRKDLQLFTAPLSGYTLIYLNLQNPNVPFLQDAPVHQALLSALDRQALLDKALNGQGLIADTPILPGTWAHDETVARQKYDPDRARKLLEDAGWKDADGDGVREQGGRKLAFILLGSEQPLIDQIAEMWAKVGVKATPQKVTLAGLTTDFLATRSYEAAVVHWELEGDPDPYPLWHSTQARDGQNYAGWNDRAADETLERARALVDTASRRAQYVEFQRIFAAKLPALILYHPVYTYGVRTEVHDVQVGALNSPADRYREIARWYVVTRRITMGSAPVKFDTTPAR